MGCGSATVSGCGGATVSGCGGATVSECGGAAASDGGGATASDGGGVTASDGGGAIASDGGGAAASDGGGAAVSGCGGAVASDGGGAITSDGGGAAASGDGGAVASGCGGAVASDGGGAAISGGGGVAASGGGGATASGGGGATASDGGGATASDGGGTAVSVDVGAVASTGGGAASVDVGAVASAGESVVTLVGGGAAALAGGGAAALAGGGAAFFERGAAFFEGAKAFADFLGIMRNAPTDVVVVTALGIALNVTVGFVEASDACDGGPAAVGDAADTVAAGYLPPRGIGTLIRVCAGFVVVNPITVLAWPPLTRALTREAMITGIVYMPGKVVWFVIVLVVLLVCVLLALDRAASSGAIGGRAMEGSRGFYPKGIPIPVTQQGRYSFLVIDTLNLAHFLGFAPISTSTVIQTVDFATPRLIKYADRLLFVLKDPTGAFLTQEDHQLYRDAAIRNRVHIVIAEKYVDPPIELGKTRYGFEHASKGRDDFYMSLLAKRYRSPVLTADKLRDFGEFRKKIPAFHTIEFDFWRELPTRDYIKPDAFAYSRLRRPATIHPREVFPAQRREAQRSNAQSSSSSSSSSSSESS